MCLVGEDEKLLTSNTNSILEGCGAHKHHLWILLEARHLAIRVIYIIIKLITKGYQGKILVN